ncbi:DUF4276 family protein [Blastopirellula marina]|uniref:DUF4276 family protein n=1 Tax=Blastopirellula marina DSM 3645 TaxID=314230 RepID=A3ZRZ7_9BACT|nr:DUF4276 family protein [Blastopirellula marina]EAQ80919.1 hypothetical protein DSM3645_12901 [Blastopirellula marina DSM 3645]
MKFVMVVEGRTEGNILKPFLKRWLDPQLSRPVGIDVKMLDGHGNFLRQIATRTANYLRGRDEQEIIAVIGLLDLYGPDFYPADKNSAAERYEWGVDHFENVVGSDRFRMFFAVHEIEAWLFSDPAIFPRNVQDLFGALRPPEQINFNRPPGHLLKETYRRTNREYRKTLDGSQLFGNLDPAVAADKCPYLRRMLNTMLDLAQAKET